MYFDLAWIIMIVVVICWLSMVSFYDSGNDFFVLAGILMILVVIVWFGVDFNDSGNDSCDLAWIIVIVVVMFVICFGIYWFR